jgi:hypothetical protein
VIPQKAEVLEAARISGDEAYLSDATQAGPAVEKAKVAAFSP